MRRSRERWHRRAALLCTYRSHTSRSSRPVTTDNFIKQIANHSRSERWRSLPAPVVHECKRRIIDTLGCAIAAFDAEPSRIARELGMRVSAQEGARMLGTNHRTLLELATFTN